MVPASSYRAPMRTAPPQRLAAACVKLLVYTRAASARNGRKLRFKSVASRWQ